MQTLTPATHGEVIIHNWACNGMINPLIRTYPQLCAVAGANLKEAIRWAAIHLHTYKKPGLPARVDHIMTNGGTWDPTEEECQQIFKLYRVDKETPVWKQGEPIMVHKSKGELRTPAQLIAVFGGCHSSAQCYDFADLLRSLDLVGSYNGFEVEKNKEALRKFNCQKFYGVDNPNSGNDAFTYTLAWEGSHALYIECCLSDGQLRIIADKCVRWYCIDYSDFSACCSSLARQTKADESDLVEDRDGHGLRWLKWRLWWD